MKNCLSQNACTWKHFRDVDAFQDLTNSIISSLLVDGPTSPFYQALIETNIGSDYSPATGWVYEIIAIGR